VLQASADVMLVDPVTSDLPLMPDPSVVREAASLVRASERPVTFAGGGVVAGDASQALVEPAERVQCPVGMSNNGLQRARRPSPAGADVDGRWRDCWAKRTSNSGVIRASCPAPTQ
jgi:thiamine pyrophosphate-dependent acetolactate synthase large subunit-like protein